MVFGNHNFPCHGIQLLRKRRFVPHMQRITALRHMWNQYLAAAVRDAVVGGDERNDHSTHFGMNVAKDVGDPRPVEKDRLCGSSLIQAKIEAFPFKQRKYIVEKG